MIRETKEILTGTLTIAVFAIMVSFVTAPGDASNIESEQINDGHYRISAVFSMVDGLYSGDDVRLGGIKVGSVESLTLDSSYRAVLVFAIREDVPLPLDTSVAIHTSGLFGSKFVELEPGGDYDFLTNGDEIMFAQGSIVISDLLDLIITEGKAKRGAQN
jgi:phospholipid/cholesterol/gamma-HCH transport system substrate-binding protein